MATAPHEVVERELRERRARLEVARGPAEGAPDVERLLAEVDAALARLAAGAYGLCEVCHEPVEAERLAADPLARFCLGHLSEAEQRVLEQDLQTAARIQRGLLPERELAVPGWEVSYHWEPAGLVSGDWCDVIRREDELCFMFGDVAGKGVAAAILMSHLHATFRALSAAALPPDGMVERANRIFRESTPSPYFATLVCGRALPKGEVELCNAGHCPPLLVSGSGVEAVPPTGLPVGTFYAAGYTSRRLQLDAGDALVLYTDGLTEARDRGDAEYGSERLAGTLARARGLGAGAIVATCLDDLAAHLGGVAKRDDLTVMAIRRTA